MQSSARRCEHLNLSQTSNINKAVNSREIEPHVQTPFFGELIPGTCGGAQRPRPARVHLNDPHRRFLPLARRTGAGHLDLVRHTFLSGASKSRGNKAFDWSFFISVGSHHSAHSRVRPFLTGAGADPAPSTGGQFTQKRLCCSPERVSP